MAVQFFNSAEISFGYASVASSTALSNVSALVFFPGIPLADLRPLASSVWRVFLPLPLHPLCPAILTRIDMPLVHLRHYAPCQEAGGLQVIQSCVNPAYVSRDVILCTGQRHHISAV